LAVSTDGLPLKRACELDQEPPEERWLLAGLWARSAIGLIGGAPKCCKTWLGLDMAVSVASATPALGRFACESPGPALVYLAEDGLPQVRSRIEALCKQRGADIRSLDLSVITAPILRLDLTSDQERLARTVEAMRPRMLLLDPLVRLHRLDENSAAEISGLLGYIRDLQRRFDLAVVLVHHASKKQRSQPGQALRGSSDLHAIGDSNAYLARDGEHIVLTIEHRAAPAPEPLRLELVADPSARRPLCACSPPRRKGSGPTSTGCSSTASHPAASPSPAPPCAPNCASTTSASAKRSSGSSTADGSGAARRAGCGVELSPRPAAARDSRPTAWIGPRSIPRLPAVPFRLAPGGAAERNAEHPPSRGFYAMFTATSPAQGRATQQRERRGRATDAPKPSGHELAQGELRIAGP
jgi:hypothetical protein